MKRIITLFLIILIISFSDSTAADNPASTGLSFLKIGAGAHAAGMGEAFTAGVNDASGTYWNAAGIARTTSTELMFTHNKWLQDITNEFFAVTFRAGKHVFGISFMSNTVGGIERRIKPTTDPIGTFNAHDVMFGLSYARNVHTNLAVGITAKFLYQKIYVESSSGFAFDLGLQYQTFVQGLRAGMALQNFGYMTELNDQSPDLPQTIRMGFAYQLPWQLLQGQLTLASDYVHVIGSTSHVNLGLEYNFKSLFSIRLGYQTGYEEKGIQGGFGVGFKRYRLDYAFVPFTSDLGNSHRITFGMSL